jgi:AcrR family transcriptional regulator
MPRPALHDTDELLDAARDLIVEGGPRAAGIRAIAQRSGAPSGSLYHRFGSRDHLVAQAWLRAVRRFQAGFLTALDRADPRAGVANAVHWGVSFTLSNPADTRLLLDHSRKDLLDSEPAGSLAADLAAVNDPLVRAMHALAARLYGTSTAETVERVSYAIIDLPQAVLRRHLRAGTLSAATADALASAARALVSDAPVPTRARTSRQHTQRRDP